MATFASYAGQLSTKLQEYRTLGQKEAAKSRPPQDAAVPDQNETALSAEAERHLNAEQFLFDTVVTDASKEAGQARQKSIQHQFSVDQLLSDTDTISAVEAELSNERMALVRATEQRLRTEADLKYFRAANDIHEEAHYPESVYWHLGIIASVALIEMLVNTFFFENEQGLLGGFVVAAGLAIANMGTALLLGFFFRYKNLAAAEKRIGAWLCLPLFLIATIFINALFAAFRSEYQLVADPTEASQITEAFARAWPEAVSIFRADMQIKDQMSFVLLVVGILLSCLAFWKGYTIDDKYPDHGRKDKKYRRLLADEQRLHENVRQKVKEHLHHRKAAVHAAIQEPANQMGIVTRRIAEMQHARTLLENQAGAIDREYAMVIDAYRGANISVRVVPAPAYFKTRPTISMKADGSQAERVTNELQAVQLEIKAAAEGNKDALNARLQGLQIDTTDVLKKTMSAFIAEIQKEAEDLVAASVQTMHRIKAS